MKIPVIDLCGSCDVKFSVNENIHQGIHLEEYCNTIDVVWYYDRPK